MSQSRARIAFLMFALGSLICSGCIEGRVFTFARYEPKDDSFLCIQVYTNIHATQKVDLDHLESLWKRRQSIIIQPVELLGLPAFERKGKNTYCLIDLGSPSEKQTEAKSTNVDLDSIKVTPGEFYLNTHGNLGYYQQIAIPGKTIDALFKEVISYISREVTEFAEEQARLAGKDNVKPVTWDRVRKGLVEDILIPVDPTNPKKKDDVKGDELMPLEMASLQLLIKAGKDKAITVSRNRDIVTLVVPLTKRDCNEVIATFDFIRKVCDERIKNGKPVELGVPEALEAFKFKSVEGSGLEVTADMTKVFKALTATHAIDGKIDLDLAPPNELKMGCKTTVTSIQGRGVTINKTLSIKDVVASFWGK